MPNRLLVTEVAVIEPVTIKPSVNVTKPDELTCNAVFLAAAEEPAPTANAVFATNAVAPVSLNLPT